jgi:ADP-ribosylglycohydrolase
MISALTTKGAHFTAGGPITPEMHVRNVMLALQAGSQALLSYPDSDEIPSAHYVEVLTKSCSRGLEGLIDTVVKNHETFSAFDSLFVAFACFAVRPLSNKGPSEMFETGCKFAANGPGDSDTIAAIFGQLFGTCYGADSIGPWLSKLERVEELDGVCAAFVKRRPNKVVR